MKGDAFSRYGGCRVVMPNGLFSFVVFNVDVQWLSAKVRPNDHFFICSILVPSQSLLLLLCR